MMKSFATFLRWLGLDRLADKIDPPTEPNDGGPPPVVPR